MYNRTHSTFDFLFPLDPVSISLAAEAAVCILSYLQWFTQIGIRIKKYETTHFQVASYFPYNLGCFTRKLDFLNKLGCHQFLLLKRQRGKFQAA